VRDSITLEVRGPDSGAICRGLYVFGERVMNGGAEVTFLLKGHDDELASFLRSFSRQGPSLKGTAHPLYITLSRRPPE
jgi:hypothetical protein